MGGMGMSPTVIVSQPNSPYTEQVGQMYRSGYCAVWLLTIAGGFVAVAVRWLTLGTIVDAQPRSGERI